MLVPEVAEMPGPQETLGEDDKAGSKDGEANPRRSVAETIAGAGE
jgi:hypothetical protein